MSASCYAATNITLSCFDQQSCIVLESLHVLESLPTPLFISPSTQHLIHASIIEPLEWESNGPLSVSSDGKVP